MTCKKHPKYKGKSKPTSTCERCWAIWLGMTERCLNCGCHLAEDPEED